MMQESKMAGSSIGGIWRALARLAGAWWSVDRVRVAQRQGRILRMRPPAVIVLDGREIEVRRRSVTQGVDGAFVTYECQTSEGPAQLRVVIVTSFAAQSIVWIENGREQARSEDEFELWEA